jgi:hypothetical protein
MTACFWILVLLRLFSEVDALEVVKVHIINIGVLYIKFFVLFVLSYHRKFKLLFSAQT